MSKSATPKLSDMLNGNANLFRILGPEKNIVIPPRSLILNKIKGSMIQIMKI